MNKISVFGLCVMAMVFVACGGESSSGNEPITVATGTGYYVDSAVAGATYECGTQKGVTDASGKFTYDKDAGCIFSLAGVKLRETSASSLVDGGKIIENDPTVARFLQSLDNDGNASNGIQITKEVIAILTAALQGAGSDGKVPSDTKVNNVVTYIETNVPTYEGSAKTPEQVEEHLATTQTEVTKALLAGKTLYQLGTDDGDVWLNKFVVNADATSVNITSTNGIATDNVIEIDGNKLIPSGDGIIDGFYSVLTEQTSDYLFFQDYSEGSKVGESKFYFDQAKAQAAYDALVGSTPPVATDLQTLLAGKTFYNVGKDARDDSSVWLNKYVFNADATSLNLTRTNGVATDYVVEIDGNKLIPSGDDISDSFYSVLTEQTSDYLFFQEYSEGSKDAESKFYFDQTKAQAAYDALVGSTPPVATDLQTLLTGKTFYRILEDGHDENGVVKNYRFESLEFDSPITSITDTILASKDGKDIGRVSVFPATYSNDTIQSTGDSYTSTITLESQTDDYVRLKSISTSTGEISYDDLYFIETKAQAAYDALVGTVNSTVSGAALYAGKTLYVPGIDGETPILTKGVFNATATYLVADWIIGPVMHFEGEVILNGNSVTVNSGNLQEYLGQTTDYISIREHHVDNTTFDARWYYDEAKALQYLKDTYGYVAQ